MTQYLNPPIEEWNALAVKFTQETMQSEQRATSESFRALLTQMAQEYTLKLKKIAQEHNIELPVEIVPGKKGRPIIMSGHQPVIYHPGLLFKEQNLERFAQQHDFQPIHIVVDTDEGAGGAFCYPEISDNSAVASGIGSRLHEADDIRLENLYSPIVQLGVVSISEAQGLFLNQKIGTIPQLQEAFGRAEASLSQLELEQQLEAIRTVRGLYEKLSGVSLVAANSIVRWATRGRSHLEVPFSSFLEEPSVQALLASWIQRGASLAQSYNSVLERFRAERKIKNSANPFPNMQVREGAVELPFWLIHRREGVRMPCIVSTDSKLASIPDTYLAPRGSITTLLLRGYCTDIFIHGRGGAKYDPFVDLFANSEMKLSLAPFVVASQDRRIFPRAYDRVRAATELKEQYKEIVSHTDKFLTSGIFSESDVQLLTSKVKDRVEALQSLKDAQDAESRSASAHRLNAINREIKQILDTGSLQQGLEILSADKDVQDAWSCREYPFFLFIDH